MTGAPAAVAHGTREDVVHARGLRKAYGDTTVVDGLDLHVRRGQCFGLLGPNGAGKTTTLRMLLGLSRPDAGELEVLGYRIPRQARRMRARIGVVPQMDNLDPEFSVVENLRIYGRYFGISHDELNARIPALLEFAALEKKAHTRIDTLSGGMKRRLTLARALVNDPELLILDEPTTGLDPQARQIIWQRLRQLIGEGRTLILTTHYMEEAERLCDELIIMDHGRILAQGSPAELVRDNIEPQVVELHGPGMDRWVAENTDRYGCRIECVGETAFCYMHEKDALVDALTRQQGVDFLHRRANLEDVFLKLTGRDLRD
ncbi:MAG TPA: ATP-binding cassette domain-containing protein [Gammaproteobacteria bacterium]|nr:ATP-binding cassette domain-containing protein [Gammaproteobacteria bacterium]